MSIYLLQCKGGKYFSKTLYKNHIQEVDLEDYLSLGNSFGLTDYQEYLSNISKSELDNKGFKIVKFIKEFKCEVIK